MAHDKKMMMKEKDMGDSGRFGPAMKNMPNSNYKPKLTGIAKARSVGGKALAKGLGGAKLQGSRSELQGSGANPLSKVGRLYQVQGGNNENATTINQGNYKGQRSLKVRRTSTGYMRK